ncbi:epoxyqueuosine reductase [Oxobacter pfennigii]|uniref:Epoxyqueuosine reductase n=1 Tax=Oxobacter pfennigii TaxID=36849 RepID=A0A0P8W7T2_9CLOT|nr:4Fe-4S binding protein [Oxobacter pfennigii]KPU43821.1 epoxyqueuosine reductase [Oxobacter pfennigii]
MIKLSDIEEIASKFILASPLNKVKELDIEIYEVPVFSVAGACDPLFMKLKDEDVISSNHMAPTEWLAGAKSVISYFLPFSYEVRKSNIGAGLPSKEWLYGRIEGEKCNNALRDFIASELKEEGYEAVVPALDERFKVENRKSNWSERHAAYIAGLGTFSLSKSLITSRGCAGRFGSIITNLPLEPNNRPYNDIYDYCTFCGACILRCPSGAITSSGKDTAVCSAYIDKEILSRYKPRYGCGKCQTMVPCEHSIP